MTRNYTEFDPYTYEKMPSSLGLAIGLLAVFKDTRVTMQPHDGDRKTWLFRAVETGNSMDFIARTPAEINALALQDADAPEQAERTLAAVQDAFGQSLASCLARYPKPYISEQMPFLIEGALGCDYDPALPPQMNLERFDIRSLSRQILLKLGENAKDVQAQNHIDIENNFIGLRNDLKL